MIGPKKRPQDFIEPENTWHHIVVNDPSRYAKCFTQTGKQLWLVAALARGQDDRWTVRRGDTPPGLYEIGQVYPDYENHGDSAPYSTTLMSYGWYSFDLIDLEGQEGEAGRAGIMLHGGGSGCGWPGAWFPEQALFPTHGCVRMHNKDLRDKVMPLTKAGRVFVSVWQ